MQPLKSPSSPPLRSEATKDTTPATLRECLAPLAAAATQTSVMAYRWGLKAQGGSLMRAAAAMDLAGNVITECNAMLKHSDSEETVKRDVNRQMAATTTAAA